MPAAPDHLDSSKTYLVTNDVLRAMGLFYHNHFKVLLCTCGKAVLPNACVAHVGGHGIKVSGAVQAAFKNLIWGLGIATALTGAPCPPPRGPPVEVLTLWKGGFCCNFCGYCACVKKSLSNHWYQSHHDRPEVSLECRFHRAAVQTFYAPAGERYFEVNPDLAGLSPDDVFTIYMCDEVPKFAAFPTTIPEDEHEVPPLLQVTQWHVHLSAYSSDPQRRETLWSLVKLPPSASPAGIGCLGTITFKYLREIRSPAKNSDFGVLTLLMECPQ
jgi:Orsellinic acid/F9775 biosynthesis cluster protein D